YIGTTPDLEATTNIRQGKIFRIDDPRNFAATATPVDITPVNLQGNVQNIAVNPNNDNEIMAVVSNYDVVSIWWTNNAKSASPTWRNAEGNLTLPSVRSCMIVVKKDAANNPVTEYYVGTSVGLYSVVNLGTILTANSSPTWEREGDNVLNYAVVQSLSYRPTDNVLLVGTHGNGMYYTFLGSANFTPNGDTGTVNDSRFIVNVFPTQSSTKTFYQVGNAAGVQTIIIQLLSTNGQLISKKETPYQNGEVDMSRLPAGMYILNIQSSDGKYRHIQKLIKR
ncbi:MAG TPA: T9SS type A sorting domain-containing protein, partial [Flavisolibacter sp.]|nr:T9SS type A sorting domain-containing protein [Flavisolibacter sp.]